MSLIQYARAAIISTCEKDGCIQSSIFMYGSTSGAIITRLILSSCSWTLCLQRLTVTASLLTARLKLLKVGLNVKEL